MEIFIKIMYLNQPLVWILISEIFCTAVLFGMILIMFSGKIRHRWFNDDGLYSGPQLTISDDKIILVVFSLYRSNLWIKNSNHIKYNIPHWWLYALKTSFMTIIWKYEYDLHVQFPYNHLINRDHIINL